MNVLRHRGPIEVAFLAALGALGPLLLVDGLIKGFLHYMGLGPGFLDWPSIRRIQSAFLALEAGFLGLIVALRYPIRHTAYANWLKTTPWRPGRALPLGSPLPQWRDWLALIVIALVCQVYLHQSSVPLVIAFAVGYALASLVLSIKLPPLFAGGIVALLAAMCRMYPNIQAMLVISIIVLGVACLGMFRALHLFPWDYDEPKWPEPQIGSVVARIGPKLPSHGISPQVGWIVSIVIGWLVYCGLAQSQMLNDRANAHGVMVILIFASLWLGLLRWALYCGQYWPPISLLGRITTGQLIVRGYDYVLISPIAGAICGSILPAALIRIGASPAASFGITAGLCMAIFINGRPRLRTWCLTGHHRIIISPEPKSATRQRRPASAKFA